MWPGGVVVGSMRAGEPTCEFQSKNTLYKYHGTHLDGSSLHWEGPSSTAQNFLFAL